VGGNIMTLTSHMNILDHRLLAGLPRNHGSILGMWNIHSSLYNIQICSEAQPASNLIKAGGFICGVKRLEL
jgi:hypothetical protein